MLKDYSLSILLLLFSISLFGQTDFKDTIFLSNPSFEDLPKISIPPRSWFDCGFENESPPDVHPVEGGGSFDVIQTPYHGNTYLGIVVRDNETWESVSQRLYKMLKPGKCYEFSIYLSRSETYRSLSRETEREAQYITPSIFRIWAGHGYCQKKELLGETSPVISTRWLEYRFRFEPTESFAYITFEAYYQTPTLFPYNGNILVDNASPIIEVPCDKPIEEEPEVVAENTAPKVNTPPAPPNRPQQKPTQETESKPQILKDLAAETIREGQVIRIEKLNFKADSSAITEDSYEVLDELFNFMKQNPAVVVELGGHTNTIPSHAYCDRLSKERAKAVAEYLHDKGIEWERLKYHGYGKRQPLTKDISPQGRKKNQRVEIKILSLNG